MEKKKELNAKWVYLGIALFMLIFMIVYSNLQSFWYDEVYQLGLVRSELSFKEILQNYYTLGDYTPPLFALLAAVLVRVFPFVNGYLLLVSEFAVAGGVYLLGVTAEKAKNKMTGVIATIIAGTSYILIVKAGHEFRAYGLMFFCSTLVLYAFVTRYKQGKECAMKYHILYGLALILLVYSHYFGSIVCGALVLFDLFLFIKKKVQFRASIPYFMTGVAFAPWLLLVYMYHKSSISEFWVDPPTWRTVIDVFKYLVSNSDYLFMLLVLTFIVIIVRTIQTIKKKNFSYEAQGLTVAMTWVVFFVVSSMYVYGALINPKGGIFVHRYFFCLFPYLMILIAATLAKLFEYLNKTLKIKNLQMILCLFLFLYLGAAGYSGVVSDAESLFEPYQESAVELAKKGDIEKPTTVVILPDCEYVKEGYRYYFEKKGTITKVNLMTQYEKDFATKIASYNKIYLLEGHEDYKESTKKAIMKYYKKIYGGTKYKISAYVKTEIYNQKYKDKDEEDVW